MANTPMMTSLKNKIKEALIDDWLRIAFSYKLFTCSSGLMYAL